MKTHRNPDRAFDKTSLHETQHGQYVHRDYAAHFFRWGFITQKMVDRQKRVLDIGCGVDTPLAKVLSGDMSLLPASYLGVDFNKEPKKHFRAAWASFQWEYNFVDLWPDLELTEEPFDVITCLEVVEHMRPESVKQLFAGARQLLADDGTFVLSTPVFNGKKMAKNHINEMTVSELKQIVHDSHFRIEERFGTFASHPDIMKVASAAEKKVLLDIGRYYSKAVTACFLSPLYPDASRNNIWLLKHAGH